MKRKQTLTDFIKNNSDITETWWSWYGDEIKELEELIRSEIIEDIYCHYDRIDFKCYKVKILKNVN